jgi:hypothetical protein
LPGGEAKSPPDQVAEEKTIIVEPARQAQTMERAKTELLPEKFLIHVDGGESCLVFRQRRVTLGPGGSSKHNDVPLMADSALPAVNIERNDEDYFLTAARPVEVNEAAVTHKLLAGGDRITLSQRCRLKFNLPNAASTSALLSLSGTRLPKSDARQIILLDRSMIIGPGQSAHIRASQAGQQAVLHLRNGRLYCRSDEPAMVNEKIVDPSECIPLGGHVRIGGLSFVITSA